MPHEKQSYQNKAEFARVQFVIVDCRAWEYLKTRKSVAFSKRMDFPKENKDFFLVFQILPFISGTYASVWKTCLCEWKRPGTSHLGCFYVRVFPLHDYGVLSFETREWRIHQGKRGSNLEATGWR